tara:strand:+ start:3899 stop:4735 length:837 start_codon:yes stop_codon:yes gene_type:complete
MSAILLDFKNTKDYLNWIEEKKVIWRKSDLASHSSDYKFSGTHSFDEAWQMAKYGWPQGLRLLQNAVQVARDERDLNKRPKHTFDVAGFRPSPGRAAAGDVFSMVRRGRRFDSTPIIKITTDMTYSGDTPRDRVMTWGAAICSYINALEIQGYSVELNHLFEVCSYNEGPPVSVKVNLKQPGQPLAMSSVVFWWAHPSSLRRIFFATMERLNVEKYYSQGYGIPSRVREHPSDELYLNVDQSSYSSFKTNLGVIQSRHSALMAAARRASAKKATAPQP